MSTRSRQPRLSSPHVRSANDGGRGGRNTHGHGETPRARTFLDRWVEPPLRSPIASFEAEGIERQGVVENMQPLGTLPSAKQLRTTTEIKLQLPPETFEKRLQLVQPATPTERSVPDEVLSSDAEFASPLSELQQRALGGDDDDEPRGGESALGAGGAALGAAAAATSTASSPPPSDALEAIRDRMQRVTVFASRQAMWAGHRVTALSLKELHDMWPTHEHLMLLMKTVSEELATAAQIQEFLSIMEQKKRDVRRRLTAGERIPGFDPGLLLPPSRPASPAEKSPEAAGDVLASVSASRPRRKPLPSRRTTSSHDRRHSRSPSITHVPDASTQQSPLKGRGSHAHDATTRRLSVSSTSSLSSVDEEFLAADLDSFPLSEQSDSNAPPGETRTAQARGQVSPPSTTTASSAAPSAMPAFYADQAPDSFQLPPASTKGTKRHPSTHGAAADKRALDEDDVAERMKKRARTTTNGASVTESFVRPSSEGDDMDDLTSVTGRPVGPAGGQTSRRTTDALSTQPRDLRAHSVDSDAYSSPTASSFPKDGAARPPGSALTSRAGTPNRLTRPSRKGKSGPRVKTSPMKKKSGPLAGIARASGERNSPIGNGVLPHNQDENDDYCSSCSGSGDLVCCDGCTRSFHFNCVDPPMMEGELPDTWFCNICTVARHPPPAPKSGAFSQLFYQLQKKNPSAFALPKSVREYFDGVKTGADGEYEEAAPNKPKTRGYDDTPDYLRLRDSKGKAIICHNCHESATTGKPMIPCSFCALSWHLDCLNPPLANPPPPGKMWRCPCHVDDLLSGIPGSLGPAHRVRKIRGSSAIRPAIMRGLKNNGHIEIDNPPSDDESAPEFFERREYGRVYKLPEQGVKLDFIARLRRTDVRSHASSRLKATCMHCHGVGASRAAAPFDRRRLEEQQAALNLTQLASHSRLAAEDQTHLLVNALLHEASPDTIKLIAQGDASRIATAAPSRVDRQALLAIKALIDAQLARAAEPTSHGTPGFDFDSDRDWLSDGRPASRSVGGSPGTDVFHGATRASKTGRKALGDQLAVDVEMTL